MSNQKHTQWQKQKRIYVEKSTNRFIFFNTNLPIDSSIKHRLKRKVFIVSALVNFSEKNLSKNDNKKHEKRIKIDFFG